MKLPDYRAKDLLTVPGLLTLARVPLAVVFPFIVDRPWAAIAVLFTAGLTDVLDGWYARRFHQVTVTGAAVDPITDKAFVAAVVLTLLVKGLLTPVGVLLLAARELGELPLVLYFLVSHARRRKRVEQPMANAPGKAATLLQFVAVTLAMLRSPHTGMLLVATCIVGAAAALIYWLRELTPAMAKSEGKNA